MTADDFRSLALALPEACEGAHMGHPDFRVKNKIFASLGPDAAWGMVKLLPDQQRTFLRTAAGAFAPAAGAWGQRGATIVHLSKADAAQVRQALDLAWRNTAPKKLVQQHPE